MAHLAIDGDRRRPPRRRPLRSLAKLLMATTLPVVAAVSTAVLPAEAQAQTGPAAGATPDVSAVPSRQIVVLGDSTALDLSYALAATAPPGFRVIGSATFGCGLAMGTEISAFPPKPELPSAPACNDATPPAWQWPAIDTRAVADTGPRDIVLFLAGHDDTTGILQDGRWSDIRSPCLPEDGAGADTRDGGHRHDPRRPPRASDHAVHERGLPLPPEAVAGRQSAAPEHLQPPSPGSR